MTTPAASARVLDFPQDTAQAVPPVLDLGLLSAVGLAFLFSAARVIDISPDGKAIMLLGVLLVGLAVHAALLAPQRYPLLLVAYLPFNLVFSFVSDVSGVNMVNFLLALGLVAFVAARMQHGPGPRLTALDGALILFAILGFVGMIRAFFVRSDADVFDVVLDYKRWVSPITLYFLSRGLVRGRDDAARVLWTIVLTCMMISLITWREGAELAEYARNIEESRTKGIMLQENSMGAFMAYYGVPMLVLALRWRSLPGRMVSLGGFLVTVRAMIYTYSRGAFLAVTAGSLVTLLLANPLYLLAAGGVGGAMLSAGYMPEAVAARFNETHADDAIYEDGVGENLDQSSAHRLILWQGGAEIMRQHPFTGVGLGSFGRVVGQYTEVPLRENDPVDAHNAYVLTGAELGVPALVLMIVLLFWLAARAVFVYWRHSDPGDRSVALALMGSLCAIIVSCMFGSRFADDSLVGNFWILAGAVSALRALGPTAPAEEAW